MRSAGGAQVAWLCTALQAAGLQPPHAASYPPLCQQPVKHSSDASAGSHLLASVCQTGGPQRRLPLCNRRAAHGWVGLKVPAAQGACMVAARRAAIVAGWPGRCSRPHKNAANKTSLCQCINSSMLVLSTYIASLNQAQSQPCPLLPPLVSSPARTLGRRLSL